LLTKKIDRRSICDSGDDFNLLILSPNDIFGFGFDESGVGLVIKM